MKLQQIFIFLLISLYVNAQDIAPDFSMTDIHGNEWNLYEQLDNGKTVLLDFFFVDCRPCQEWTPEVVQIFEDYGSGNNDLQVFGISHTDDNTYIQQFENDFSVSYPSCGIEGGGDTITDLYTFTWIFLGWPTYAVVCPNREIIWDIRPFTEGMPEIREVIDSCLVNNNIGDIQRQTIEFDLYPNPVTGTVKINTFAGNDLIIVHLKNFHGSLLDEISLSNQSLEIDMTGYNPGFYIVELYENKKFIGIRKLIKL